jgi:DNA (cytosine-5)-methyltransferase 1
MRYVSLFAGIEAASQGWHHMGWEPVAFADIDAFPSAVLAHHYPDVPNLGNVEGVDWSEYRGKAEVVVGGSPCQSFSVAGKRLGMDDPRGNLALEFIRAVAEIQPTWFVFENVPGLLSSDEGRDFGIFLGQVAQIGYGFAYRVLDSQYFGVPQRRRRVFVVGHIGNDWRSAASVLFERESLQGNSKESKAQGKAITEYIGTSTSQQGEPGRRVIPKITGTIDTDCGGGKLSVQHASSGHLIPETEPIAFEQNQRSEVRETEVAGPIKAEKGSNNQTFIAQNWDGKDKTGTLTTRSMQQFMPDKDNFMAVVEPTPDSEIFDSWALNENPRNVSPTLNASLPYTSGDPIVTEPEIFDETNPNGRTDVSPTLNARDSGSTGDPIVHETIGFDWKNAAQTNFDKKNSGAPVTAEGGLAVGQPIVSPTLTSHNLDSRSPQSAESTAIVGKVLDASKHKSMAVRRLTPVECERLQGFPDNYTQISWKGKPPEDCPDGPRYKALGNSMAVPVMRWIGEGIQMVDDLVRGLDERADSKTTEQKSLFDF